MNYELFSGLPDLNPLWLETVAGLPQAIERMKERARTKPGSYFIYSCDQGMVVASFPEPSPEAARRKGAAKDRRARFETA